MAVLINGNGNEAIYAQQDADWFASIMGNQTAITAIGSKFAATLEDANTIGVADGVIITQEGRRIQLDVNELDLFDIPAGGQGQTNYYIIGYHLVTGDLSEQYCETFVRLMDNDTDTIPEDTFRSGADEVFVSLYRVTQVNLAITDMELLLPEITTVAQISQHLTAQDDTSFQFRVDGEGNYGYLKGDGTFSPFSLGVKLIAYGCNGGTSYSMNKNFVDTDYINRTITSESHILEFITDCKGLFDVLNANTVNWGNVGHTQITNHIGTYNYNFYNFEAHTGDIITITTGSSVGAWNGYDVFV